MKQTMPSGKNSLCKPDADHHKFKGIYFLLANVWIKWVKSQKDWTLPSRLTCIHPRKPCRILPSGAAKPPTLTVFSLDSRSFPSTSILAWKCAAAVCFKGRRHVTVMMGTVMRPKNPPGRVPDLRTAPLCGGSVPPPNC